MEKFACNCSAKKNSGIGHSLRLGKLLSQPIGTMMQLKHTNKNLHRTVSLFTSISNECHPISVLARLQIGNWYSECRELDGEKDEQY